MVRLGVIGCGHWGPNHIRNFSHILTSKEIICADLDEKRLKNIKDTFRVVNTIRELKKSPKDVIFLLHN